MDQARAILRDTFGYADFRLTQAQVINRLLEENANALVLFPTGGGKSLCYQIPGIILPGLTLVISPLIALMKDQVDALRARGVSASNWDSTLSLEEVKSVREAVLDGSLKILYVAPERLNNETFMDILTRVKISLLAVDESHCISQWGASFRPDYLKIARFAQENNVERCLCLTATATPEIAKDICNSFEIDPEAGLFKTPMYRPNLSFLVRTAKDLDDKIAQIIPILNERTGPVIVYVTRQEHTEQARDMLRIQGDIEAETYHAGMTVDQRRDVQERFMTSEKGVIVCTIAFGMGIDKSDIRQVIHLHLPKTLENYSQEVGRAGRDGLPSQCVVFLCAEDIPALEGFARGDTCSLESIQLWLGEVMLKKLDPDGTIWNNLYEQGKTYDMRATVLGLLYAELELLPGFEYLRAVTPCYAIYYFTPRSEEARRTILADTSPLVKFIRTRWRTKSTGYEIDVVENATETHSRAQMASRISQWEIEGLVENKPSQVRHRYRVLQPLPTRSEEIEAIAKKLHNGQVTREEDSIKRLYKVIEFATSDDCLAHTLASYFGDDEAVPGGICGKCTFCLTGAGTEFAAKFTTTADPLKIRAVLNACGERDDPRLLARLAFGITSPRLTADKLTRDAVFGLMGDVDFNVLLDVFTKECDAVGRVSLPKVGVEKKATTKKRTYAGSQSESAPSSSRGRGRGRGRGGIASSSKRGRYY